MLRRLLAAALAALTFAASTPVPAAGQVVLSPMAIARWARMGAGATAGPATGDPTALRITSGLWTSPTDLAPLSQFVDGYSGDLTLQGMTPAGATAAYAFGTDASPKLSFVNQRPGYSVVSGAITSTPVNQTIWAKTWLRQVYANGTSPTESANGGNAKIAISFSDLVFSADTPGQATASSALYTSGIASNAKSNIPVSNGSGAAYPPPIGAWLDAPGQRIGSGQGLTVEFTGGQAYGQGGIPLGGVVITAYDAGAAHSVAKTIAAPTISTKQLTASCTGTNGSAVLTGCNDTSGFIVGMRLTVPGIPGQPRLLSKTANSLTLGSAQTCVTTLNNGDVSLGTVASLANGDALADGGFAGATLSDANISGGVATITSETVTADITQASLKATAAKVHTGATTVTAAAAHSCTLNHVFQGSTGSVTVTAGNPVQAYAAVFSSSDFASLSDGLIYFRAQAYPVAGNVALDSQTGADGTNCDWWFKNVNAGACNGSSAANFNVDGTDISPNLHNLWAYLDKAGTYVPAYVWVKSTGTCTTSACVSTSATDPGGAVGNYAATILQAQTNLKAWYNANKGHNDPQGGVICVTAGTYSGFGGTLATATVAKKPSLTLTSALGGGDCPVTGSANNDLPNVTLDTNATQGNRTVGTGMRFNNLTIGGAGVVLQGADGGTTAPTAFPTTELTFNNDKFVTGAASTTFKLGSARFYNSVLDQGTTDGNLLSPASGSNGSAPMVLANTLICGSFTTFHASYPIYNALGNVGWGCSPVSQSDLAGTPAAPQALSGVIAFNKWMGLNAKSSALSRPNNTLLTTNIYEAMNTNSVPALQVSGDNINVALSNVVRTYETAAGARSNNDYLEGLPLKLSPVASGGSFAANTYYLLIAYALVGNPTVETSTDGIFQTTGTFGGASIVLNGSATIQLPCDNNYVAYIYVDSTVTGTGTAATLGHYGTVGGVDGKQLAMCQTITVTGLGSAHTSPSPATTTGHNELKGFFYQRFNIDQNFNMKSDWYGGTTGQSGGVGSGGKVGNFQGRYRAGWIGNVAVSGTSIGGTFGPTSGLGEALEWQGTYNPASNDNDISWVKYKSDRSIGSSNATTTAPQSPALNLGHGNYCPDTSVTHALGLVPSGLAAWPYDIQGLPRLNNGNGAAGAYERGCT